MSYRIKYVLPTNKLMILNSVIIDQIDTFYDLILMVNFFFLEGYIQSILGHNKYLCD